jgi:hypothetical protein
VNEVTIDNNPILILLFWIDESTKTIRQKSNNNPHIIGIKNPVIKIEITPITKIEGKK